VEILSSKKRSIKNQVRLKKRWKSIRKKMKRTRRTRKRSFSQQNTYLEMKRLAWRGHLHKWGKGQLLARGKLFLKSQHLKEESKRRSNENEYIKLIEN
jgi:hypothetical protein